MNVQKQSRATILSLLFDCDVTQEKGVVLIEVETRKKMGKIMKEGLLRSCCCIVDTVGNFHKHDGGITRKHYYYILIAKTSSLPLSSMFKAYFTNVGFDSPVTDTRG